MLLALAERRRKVAEHSPLTLPFPRPLHITHTVADVLRARMLAIAAAIRMATTSTGCAATRLQAGVRTPTRHWQRPVLAAHHLALGECADAAGDHSSHLYTRRHLVQEYAKPPKSVVLDIDDTVDVVDGHQQLAQWNAHYDERCFLPIHVYDTATGRPVVVILRPGKTPSGKEVRKLLSRLIGRIRRHWPDTRITIG